MTLRRMTFSAFPAGLLALHVNEVESSFDASSITRVPSEFVGLLIFPHFIILSTVLNPHSRCAFSDKSPFSHPLDGCRGRGLHVTLQLDQVAFHSCVVADRCRQNDWRLCSLHQLKTIYINLRSQISANKYERHLTGGST